MNGLKHPEGLVPTRKFLRRMSKNILLGIFLVLLALFFGMVGYRHFEKMSWVDSYVNAAMILSGMGPISTLETESGKIFAGTYALFSGIFFLAIIAIIFGPVVHRMIQKFHLAENKVE